MQKPLAREHAGVIGIKQARFISALENSLSVHRTHWRIQDKIDKSEIK